MLDLTANETVPALGLFFEDNTAALIRPAPKTPHGLALHPLSAPPDFAATIRNLAGARITDARPISPGALEIVTDHGPRLTLTATDQGRQLDVDLANPEAADHGQQEIPEAARRIIQTAKEMREAQRLYFQTRAPGPLAAAKRLEQAVDLALEQYGRPVYVGPAQRQLFAD